MGPYVLHQAHETHHPLLTSHLICFLNILWQQAHYALKWPQGSMFGATRLIALCMLVLSLGLGPHIICQLSASLPPWLSASLSIHNLRMALDGLIGLSIVLAVPVEHVIGYAVFRSRHFAGVAGLQHAHPLSGTAHPAMGAARLCYHHQITYQMNQKLLNQDIRHCTICIVRALDVMVDSVCHVFPAFCHHQPGSRS